MRIPDGKPPVLELSHELPTMEFTNFRRSLAKSDQAFDVENKDGHLIVTGDAINIVLDESSLEIDDNMEFEKNRGIKKDQEPEEVKGGDIEQGV